MVLALAACSSSPTYPPQGPAPPLPGGPPFPSDRLGHTLAGIVRGHRVDYAALAADRQELNQYVASIAEAGPTRTPALFPDAHHSLAYYLNAYNALVLHGVLAHWPGVGSVKDIAALYGFFRRHTFRLDGGTVTLHALENDVIRSRFAESRVHFALNCASASCPALDAEPFRAATLEAHLDRLTRAFFASDKGLALDAPAKRLMLSKILDWYRDDFLADLRAPGGPDSPTVVDYALRYLPAAKRAEVERVCGPRAAGCEVTFARYDWGLNG